MSSIWRAPPPSFSNEPALVSPPCSVISCPLWARLVFVKARLMNLKWICRNHPPCIFRSLRVALISAISPRMLLWFVWDFFSFSWLRVRASSFGFSHYESSYFTGKELMWGFYQLPSMSISVLHLGTREMIIGGSIDPVPPPRAGPRLAFQTSRCQCQLGPCIQKTFKMVEYSPFSSVQSSWVHFHRLLWEGTEEVMIIYPFYTLAGSFLGGLASPLQERNSGSKNWV